MSPSDEGKTYWDIVADQFRKNRLATAAIAPLAVLALAAVYAPFLANHRPLAFRGYAKKAYAQQYREWRFGVHAEFERIPGERVRVRDLWAKGKPTLADARSILDAADRARLGVAAEDASAQIDPNLWARGEAPLADLREALPPERRPAFDALVTRATERIDAVFRDRTRDARQALRLKLRYLADQIEIGRAEAIDRLERDYDAIPEDPGDDRTKRLNDLRDRIAAIADPKGFDPARLPYRSAWHFPVLTDVNALNVFFLAISLALPLLAWSVRRPGLPIEVRWRRVGGRALAIACVAAGAWALLVPETIDTADYTGLRDGRPQEEVVADRVFWPPIAHGINEKNLDRLWEAPPWWETPSTASPGTYGLGTDGTGRDLLTRLIWGGRISLSVGFIAVAIYLFIGVVVGATAGYFRGWTDVSTQRAVEVVICIPTFYLILSVLALFGPSMANVMLVIGVTSWTGVARLTRGEFLRLGQQDFVVAARALGASPARVIFRHVLPNALAPVLVTATFGVPDAILTESALSFLGLGISIPTPSWGGILELVRENFQYWWVVTFAGLAIFVTVTCFNLVGEGLRDAMDPRLRK